MGRIRLRSLNWIVLVGCMLAFGGFAPPAHAQPANDTAFSLTTSPIFATLATTPGGQVSTPLKVQNNAQHAVTLNVKLMKFRAYGGSGDAELLDPDGDPSLKWVSFSATTIVAQPGAWNTVTMTIHPDHTAAFGYYYAVVFGQDTSGVTPTKQVTGHLTGATATLVLLDVNAPGEKRQLAVSSFTASKKLYQYLPATFNITVHNTGNVHAIPSGDIFISRDHKHNIATLTVNPNQGNVLPTSNRVFPVSWDDGFPVYAVKKVGGQIVSDKSGKPIQQLQWDFSKTNKLRFGKYYAHLLLTYDDGTKDVPIDAEVSFWVIPWKLILLIILVPLVPALVVYLIMRHRVKNLRGKRSKYAAGQNNSNN